VAKNELGTLITEIDKAIGFAQTLVNQWNDMDNRYDSLISDINDVNKDDLTFVKEDLYTAKLSWNAIEQQAGYLNNLD
ncbi:enterotoxin, partial [Bacillus anthracis]